MICASEPQIEQALVHLLSNARDALAKTPGRKTITIASRVLDEKVEVSIEDTAPGVPPSLQAKIFEPFFTTKPVGAGTGLGLSVCHSIITAHQGILRYQQAHSKGARFVFELPLQAAEPAPEGDSCRDDASTAPFHALSPSLNIMVVDDEPALGSLLRQMLEMLGHSVESFSSATEALAAIKPDRFDMVFSDFRMPIMNGGEFHTRAVQIDGRLQDRFYFVTGDTNNNETFEFFRVTPVPFLRKPFDLEKAIAAVVHRQKLMLAA